MSARDERRALCKQFPRIHVQRLSDPNDCVQRDVGIAGLELLPEPPVQADRLGRLNHSQLLLVAQSPHVGCESASQPMLASGDAALAHAPTVGGVRVGSLRRMRRTPLEACHWAAVA